MKPAGAACFAGDLPERQQTLVWATRVAPVVDLFSQKVEGTAWNTKPGQYVLATSEFFPS